jgi:hypothetical protein
MNSQNRQKMAEQLPWLVEHLLDPIGSALVALIFVSTIGGMSLSMVMSLIAGLTAVFVGWYRWGTLAAFVMGLAALVVIWIAGATVVCGLLVWPLSMVMSLIAGLTTVFAVWCRWGNLAAFIAAFAALVAGLAALAVIWIVGAAVVYGVLAYPLSTVMPLIVGLTAVFAVWYRWGMLAAFAVGLVAFVVIWTVGAAVVCGLLVMIAYFAMSLWYLEATPAERVLDATFESSDGSKRTLRELLRQLLERV